MPAAGVCPSAILSAAATKTVISGICFVMVRFVRTQLPKRPILPFRRISRPSLPNLPSSPAAALGDITPWLCILILGGNFRFSGVKNYLKPILVCVPVKLILAPALGMSLAILLPKLFGIPAFSGAEYTALFSLFAASEAVATVSMADQMDGDAELAGQVVVWTTLISAFTLFLWVALFRGLGIFA